MNKCIDCNKIIGYSSKRCISCNNKSRKKLHYCIDCNKPCYRRAKRCRKCNDKYRKACTLLFLEIIKEKNKEQGKKYYQKNKVRIQNYKKKYYQENKNRQRKYYRKNKIKLQEKMKIYGKKCREKLNKYRQNKLSQDISFKISCYIRNRINIALKRNYKKGKTFDLLGCSIPELKQHLQNRFKKGMTWQNYGFYGWHIDHIKPCCSFDLSKAREQHKCFHYSNLQPLWAKDNHRKRIKDNLLRIKKGKN